MQPSDTAYELSFQDAGIDFEPNVIVRIYGDGRVALGVGAAAHAETDAAARAFWDAVIAINPLVLARDRIAALEIASRAAIEGCGVSHMGGYRQCCVCLQDISVETSHAPDCPVGKLAELVGQEDA